MLMKLSQISQSNFDPRQWEEKGYQLPKFALTALREKTYREPTWIHFGSMPHFLRYVSTSMV